MGSDKNNDVTIVASDIHNLKRRSCKMKEAFTVVSTGFEGDITQKIFVGTPSLILSQTQRYVLNNE